MVSQALSTPQGPSQLERAQDDFQAALLRGELKARRQLAYQYQVAAKSLLPKWQQAYARLQAAKAAGATDTYLSGFIWSEHRLATLLSQAIELWQGLGQGVASILSPEMQAAGQLARQQVIDTMQQGLAGALVTKPSSVVLDFAGFPQAELDLLTSRLSDGSPINEALATRFGQDMVPMMQRELVAAVVNGENPAQVARRLARATGAHAGKTAVLLRTEMLRVYRDTQLATMQRNRKYLRGWVWVSAQQETTCAMCWAMHGTEHSLDERMETHPACRCSMKGLLRSPGEINPLLAGADLDIPPEPKGVDTFAKLPAGTQRRIMGPKLHRAYQDGRVKLSDLPKRTWSPKWGGGRVQRSTAELLGGGKPPPPKPPKTGPAGGGKTPAPPKPKPPAPIVPPPATQGPTGPTKPAGPPVSQHVDMSGLPKRGKYAEGYIGPMHETLAAIDKTHGDGSLTPVPVKLDSSRSHYGIYKYQQGGRDYYSGATRPAKPVSVGISTAASKPHVRMTFAHELGHYIDHQHFGRNDQGIPLGFGTDGARGSPKQAKWRAAVDNSRAVATLKDQLAAVRAGQHWTKGDGTTTRLDSGYLRYSLKHDELWARSYAQYIATRSGDPAFLAELDSTRDMIADTYHATQWQDDDFEPIAQAFDELFKAEGWIE